MALPSEDEPGYGRRLSLGNIETEEPFKAILIDAQQ